MTEDGKVDSGFTQEQLDRSKDYPAYLLEDEEGKRLWDALSTDDIESTPDSDSYLKSKFANLRDGYNKLGDGLVDWFNRNPRVTAAIGIYAGMQSAIEASQGKTGEAWVDLLMASLATSVYLKDSGVEEQLKTKWSELFQK